MDSTALENLTLWLALVGYVAVTIWALSALVFKRSLGEGLFWLLLCSTALHTTSLGLRWSIIDRVPVVGIYEMLSANIWGLMVAVTVAYKILPKTRLIIALLMPIIIMLMAWMMLKADDPAATPSTYDTIWLYIHIGFIKLFLGCAFIALGLALVILLRHSGFGPKRLLELPSDAGLDNRAYRFMALALVFDTLGVVSGAIWAQDAWHRYWAWDPLEVWSLVTWLCIGLTLHIRAQYKTSPLVNAWLILATWLVAFFTFFGIPFVSASLHKGMI
ncbi:cytochrome c biogenesis protein [Motiliproteus sp. SC1-56]|uniref:cytochrome c biogenesis protein n=1 Tax=Motiliproteus sp. SC1-56 TaxID=2799565 RepID=UPI001A8FF4C5|nr:cytochrome c biogenesis protein CcsA [Motiliproteus sp. SC1-56]